MTRTSRSQQLGARVRLTLGVVGVAVLIIAVVGWRVLRQPPTTPVATLPSPPAQPVEPAPRPVEVVSFAQGCTTPECHASYAEYPRIHAPVAQHACDSCHQPDTGGHVYPIAPGGNEVCLACHDLGPTGRVQHLALTEDGCLACHSPHASNQPALLVGDAMAETCGGCHTMSAGRFRHEPYDDGLCIACHEPHSGENRLLLRGADDADHCGLCHASTVVEMAGSPHGHDRIDGACLNCHAAHASDYSGLLTSHSGDQCLRCHADIRTTIESSLVTHQGAMTDRHCVTCHAPHASPEVSMLRDSQAAVCMECHDEPLTAVDGRTIPDMTAFVLDAAFEHGPVRAGDCSACHSVHGSIHDHLLKDKNPALIVGSFDARNYALCFSCHTPDLVTEPETEALTQFRQGSKNLHHTHVVGENRARSCSNCHVVHGGNRPRLMADFPPFDGSGWRMPLGFVLNERGGSCAPGCHEPMTYERTFQLEPGATPGTGGPG